MRLFQLISSDGELVALFNCTVTAHEMSNDEVEHILSDSQVADAIGTDDEDEMFELLEAKNIERVYVTEVYQNN